MKISLLYFVYLRNFFILLVTLSLCAISSFYFLKPGNNPNFLSAVSPSILIKKINEIRQKQEVGLLKENELLVKAAQLKADDMSAKEYFSHNTLDEQRPWIFLEKVGYEYEFAGENLAVNFLDTDRVYEAWMESPRHRDSILRNNYTEIGIATSSGIYEGKEAIFVVQFLAKPKEKIMKEPIVDKKNDLDFDIKENRQNNGFFREKIKTITSALIRPFYEFFKFIN